MSIDFAVNFAVKIIFGIFRWNQRQLEKYTCALTLIRLCISAHLMSLSISHGV